MSGAGASAESDFRDDAPNGRVETVEAEAETVEVEAVAVEVQPDASSEALISARRNEDSRSGNRVNVEARALVTRTGARTPETRSSGAVDALVNDGCTPA